MNKRDADALWLWQRGVTQAEIGRRFGISQARAHQIVHRQERRERISLIRLAWQCTRASFPKPHHHAPKGGVCLGCLADERIRLTDAYTAPDVIEPNPGGPR